MPILPAYDACARTAVSHISLAYAQFLQCKSSLTVISLPRLASLITGELYKYTAVLAVPWLGLLFKMKSGVSAPAAKDAPAAAAAPAEAPAATK